MAVTDDVFVKAYFAMVIETPELQTEVPGFLKDTTKPHVELLEEIHTDYRAQTTGKDIRGVPGGYTTTSTLWRRTTVETTKSKRESDIEKAWIYTPFPDNVGHLIPAEYYSQIKRWYGVL